MSEAQIVTSLRHAGPLTGAELVEATQMEVLQLWTACQRAPEVVSVTVGNRYLRLDRTIAGYARLSPSIRREFQTYTVVGLKHQSAELDEKATRLQQEIAAISQAKQELSLESMAQVVQAQPDAAQLGEQACFILAGDIVYQMAHAVARPESSTGELVCGSDLDIVVIVDDDLPESQLRALDAAIHKRKHFLLTHPHYREELDYLIKRLDKVSQQVAFDTFEHMVACKILHEGVLLWGSRRIFDLVKRMLDDQQIPAKLAELHERADATRSRAEAALLEPTADVADRDMLTLFYTREESDEIF